MFVHQCGKFYYSLVRKELYGILSNKDWNSCEYVYDWEKNTTTINGYMNEDCEWYDIAPHF